MDAIPLRQCAFAGQSGVRHRLSGDPWGPRAALSGLAIAVALACAETASCQEKGSAAANRQYAAAAALQNREQFESASEEWQKFLTAFPDDKNADKARHYLGVCLLKLEKFEPAAEAFGKVIADFPRSELLPEAHLHLGLARYKLAIGGRKELFAEAEASFSEVLAKFPQAKAVPKALYFSGESLYARGEKEAAVGRYADLTKNHPKDPLVPDALYALALAQFELGQAPAAAESCARFQADHAKHALLPEVTLLAGESLFAQGKFAEASERFSAAAAQPKFAQADHALMRGAACLAELKQYAQAAKLYASVPSRFAESKYAQAAHLEAGRCAFLANDFGQARASLARVAGQAGDVGAEAAHWIAQTYLKEKKPAEALKIVEAAIPQAGAGKYAAALELDRADAIFDTPARRGEAASLYAQIAESRPDDPSAPKALYMASYSAQGQGNHEGALAYAAKFLEKFPEHKLALDCRYLAAESHLLLGRPAEAIALYDALLSAHGEHKDNPTWRLRRALALYVQKDYQRVVEAINGDSARWKAKDQIAESRFLLGGSLLELKQYQPAFEAFQASMVANAQWRQADEALLGSANAARKLKKDDEAKRLLGQLVAKFPKSRVLDRAHFLLGEIDYAGGNFAGAAKEYALIPQNWPESPLAADAVHALGWSRFEQGDLEGASRDFGLLLEKYASHPLATRARLARAQARQQAKQYEPAMEDLTAFLATNPARGERSTAQYVSALCQVGLSKWAEAAGTLRTLLQEDPQYPEIDKVLYELGWALASSEKPAEAAEAFGRLAAERPESPLAAESLFHVGQFHYDSKDYAKAATAYFEASKKAGKTELAEEAAHKLGWAYFRQEDFAKARQSFEYQQATFPKGKLLDDAAFMEGESWLKLGKHAEAIAAYGRAKKPLGKEFGVLAMLHAGQSAATLEQWDKSLQWLTSAEKSFPSSVYLPEVLYEKAWAMKNLGQGKEAIPIFEAVTEKVDNELAARAWFMIGEIQFEQKRHSDAVKSFFKVAYSYTYPQWQAAAHYEAGRCFEVLKKTEQARKSYQEIVSKFADSDKAKLAQERLKALE